MKCLAIVYLALLLLVPSGFPQGSLTPPGAPAPTMKTLDQLEPRTPIAALPFTISASGSYYVTGNLTAAGAASGITIATSDVTLDLGGFALTGGGSGTTGRAIDVTGLLRRNIYIRNGTVRGWSNGGVRADLATAVTVEKVRVIGNSGNAGDAGLVVGANSLVQDCVASNNSAGFAAMAGIRAGDGSTVTGCVASSNGTLGFDLGKNVIVKECAASGTVLGGGFKVGENSMLINCTAMGNQGGAGIDAGPQSALNTCTASNNTGHGIVVLGTCAITNCSAYANTSMGIRADIGNVSNSNATSNGSTGIHASTVTNSVVRVNTGTGLQCEVATNCVAKDNGHHGIFAPGGVVSFCKAFQNNVNNDGGLDISAANATRTGNNPTP